MNTCWITRIPGLVVFVIAIIARGLPVVGYRLLGGTFEYDDGVYFGGALRLLHGELPYRDFVFVQPPGAAVMMAPSAALSFVVGEPSAFIGARLAIICLGGVNAWLVYRVLRPAGSVAAVAGGLFYAMYPGTVGAERTLLLEPLLNCAVLLAVLLLVRPDRRAWHAVVAGACMGAGCTAKLWLGPLVLILAWWMWLTVGRRIAAVFVAGSAGTAAVVAGPFLIAAPGMMWEQVVLDQASRSRSLSTVDRLTAIGGMGERLGAAPRLAALLFVMASLGAIVVLTINSKQGRIWLLVLAVQLTLVLISPSFYYHYAAFPGLAISVLFGLATATVLPRISRIWRRVGSGILISVLVARAAVGVLLFSGSGVDMAKLHAFSSTHNCVWASQPTLLLLADQMGENTESTCDPELDLFGMGMHLGRGVQVADPLAAQRTMPKWQELVRRELARSDGAVLLGGLDDQQWDAETQRLFVDRFAEAGKAGDANIWVLRS
jgi:hypothetical protein